ncbi:hypothetical protein [Roseibium marinum]|uniref:hypothetical protein n=1 Tax=Roseibium marinum TaxID=281252 RepID=UPI001AD8E8B3|nr:hypothetical protein [Roseibium marinum]
MNAAEIAGLFMLSDIVPVSRSSAVNPRRKELIAIVLKVNGRPVMQFSEKESASREKMEENMLKYKALYFPKIKIGWSATVLPEGIAFIAKTRKTTDAPENRSQRFEVKDLFGMAGNFRLVFFCCASRFASMAQFFGNALKNAGWSFAGQWRGDDGASELPKRKADPSQKCRAFVQGVA